MKHNSERLEILYVLGANFLGGTIIGIHISSYEIKIIFYTL